MAKIAICKTREEKKILATFLRTGNYPVFYTKEQKRILRRKAEKFKIFLDDLSFIGKDNCLLKGAFEYETDPINHIIRRAHEISHVGMKKIVDLINRKYYGISKEVVCEYVRPCEACSKFNSPKTFQLVYNNDITRKYDRYMIDCVNLRRYADQNDGFCWILNVIDTYTKYLWRIKLRSKTAVESLKISEVCLWQF